MRRPTFSSARPRLLLLAAVVATTCFALLQSFMAPLLPTFQSEYGLSSTAVSWLITAYLLSACVTAPVLGRLGDMYGHVLLLRLAMTVMTAGMILQAVSWDFTSLLAARFVQGFGGAVVPLCFVLLRRLLTEARVPTALGVVSSMAAFGGGAGLVLVGVIVAVADFRVAFCWAGAIGIASSIVVFLGIPHIREDRSARKLDPIGAILLGVWLSAVLIAVSEGASLGWASPTVILLSIVAAAAFVAWLWWEQRVPEPMIDIRVMRTRPVVWSNLLAFFFGAMLFTTQVVFPPFLQAPRAAGYGFDLSVAGTSLALLPQTAAFAIGGLAAGALERAIGSRLSIVAGSLLCTGAFALLTVRHSNVWEFAGIIFFTGLGIGLTYAQLANVVTRSVPHDKAGASTGMNTNIRNIGGAVGTAVAASVLFVPASVPFAPLGSYVTTLVILASGSAVATLCAWCLPRDRARR